MITPFAANDVVSAVSAGLLAFLWQGALIGAMAAALLAALRNAAPQTRYLVACAALFALALAPVVTATATLRQTSSVDLVVGSIVRTNLAAPSARASAAELSAVPPSDTQATSAAWRVAVVGLWALGVLLVSARLARGWSWTRRVRRASDPCRDETWNSRLRRVADRIGVRRVVALLQSPLVEVPFVTGWIRPVIVMPASALAALPPAHFEAILAHELAHIRRGDYLVNVAQCAIEALLFYHPAVWWISNRIRIEREHCCDDLAADTCDRVVYARALASLEQARAIPTVTATAVTGGDLLHRIRRLTSSRPQPRPTVSGGFAMSIALTLFLLTLTPLMVGSQAAAVTIDLPAPAADPGIAVPAPQPIPEPAPEPSRVQSRDPRPAPSSQATPMASAQAGRTVTVVVIDASGGVIPGATVTLSTPTDSRSAVTNAPGRATLTDIDSGEYLLTVAMVGFKSSRHRVIVPSDQTSTITVRLEVGSLAETITVLSSVLIAVPPAAGTPPPTVNTAPEYPFAQMQASSPTSGSASAAGAPPVPIRVGGDIRPPRKIRDVKPTYPPQAEATGEQGMVIIEATIATDGGVGSAVVLRGLASLQEAALTAVRQWRFTPTLLNGMPVEVMMTVTVNFTGR